MDWDKIRLFYEVVSAGNFTRAGEKLGVNQSSISRQISALEHDLKIPLFHRHPRGLVLTEHGTCCSGRRRTSAFAWRRPASASRRRASGRRAIWVTATVGIGGIWLARRITEFLDLYPEVRVQ